MKLPHSFVSTSRIAASLCVVVGLLGACSGRSGAGQLEVRDAWTRSTPAGLMMGVAYFEIHNRTDTPDVLVSASTPASDSVEFHVTRIQDGMASMQPMADIEVDARSVVKAEPEGLHLMLVGLHDPLVAGTPVPLTLRFRNAGDVTVQLEVRPLVDTHSH